MGTDRSKWVLIIKAAWLSANFTLWLMGLGSCLNEPTCSLARNNLLGPAFLLSFPGSVLLLISNEVLIELGLFLDVLPAMHYTFLCLTIMAVGYLQWFHIVPALFGKRKLTTLSLNQPESNIAAQTAAPDPVKLRPRVPQVYAFDRAGRSPLERVIKSKL